jgi:hypothetical protein
MFNLNYKYINFNSFMPLSIKNIKKKIYFYIVKIKILQNSKKF